MSRERDRERQSEFEAQCVAREKEDKRKAALSMYMRIYEADCDESVKDILHMIAEKVGLEP